MSAARGEGVARAWPRGALAGALAIGAWGVGFRPAWATFTKPTSGSLRISAHGLTAPTLSCGTLGVLSVNLSWTAPADTSQPDVFGSGMLASGYEVLRGTTHGGPYTVVATPSGTTYSSSLSAGDYYYVVRTTKQSWKGPQSNEVHVHAVLALVATCS